jgi:hypothetical protein
MEDDPRHGGRMILAFLAAAAVQPQWRLAVDGLGPIRIGMTRKEVESALHTRLKGEPIEDEKSCIELVPVGRDQGLWLMFEDYKLTRISIAQPSRITTPRGIGIGATAERVRRAYGRGLKAEPHKYEGRPAEYLTYWTVPGKRGVRFETDGKRRVQSIHAGTDSIQYVEGCA